MTAANGFSVSPLTPAQRQTLDGLERDIERAGAEWREAAGREKAARLHAEQLIWAKLSQIHEAGLYRADYGTWDAYCTKRWKIPRQEAYRKLTAADVVTNLSQICDISNLRQSHAVEIAKAPAELQPIIYRVATEDGGKPTASSFKLDVEAARKLLKDLPSGDKVKAAAATEAELKKRRAERAKADVSEARARAWETARKGLLAAKKSYIFLGQADLAAGIDERIEDHDSTVRD